MGSELASGKLEDERMGGESVPGGGNSMSERGRRHQAGMFREQMGAG